MSAAPASPNLTTIQSLRGFAALAVLIAHVRSSELKFDPTPILGDWALIGFAGVDLFFVISGFVMVWVSGALQGKISALPGFWAARIARIYPLWWLVLSAIVAVWLIRRDWVYSSVTTQPDLLRSYLLLPAQGLPLHAVGWTLVHEVWFYFVFGLLLIAPKRFLPALLVGWAALVIVGALLFPRPSDPFLALMRHPLTLEFILGAAIGWIATRKQLPYARIVLQLGICWFIIATLSVGMNPARVFEDEWQRVLYFAIPCAMLVWGWVGLEQGGTQSRKWSQMLGNWSYALYLIHVPVYGAVGRLCAPLAQPGPWDNLALICVAIGTAIVAAWILHIGFERPVQRLAQRLISRGGAR
jgi:exopolysaccharide production protein ExoZ